MTRAAEITLTAIIAALGLLILVEVAASRPAQEQVPAGDVVSKDSTPYLAAPGRTPMSHIPAAAVYPEMAAVVPEGRARVVPPPAPAGLRGNLAPAYSGARGSATYCAPTPRYCHGWGGDAHLGAMRSFRYGDRPYSVSVSWHGRSTVVRVVSYCECPNTLIDLSPAAFTDLAPLSRGRLYGVIVEGFDIPQPPATDTE